MYPLLSCAGEDGVTRHKRAILVPVRQGETSVIVYAGRLDGPFCFCQTTPDARPIDTSPDELRPGDPFPAGWVPGKDYALKQRSGVLKIAEKVPGGERFARNSTQAEDAERDREAERLIEACLRLRRERDEAIHHIRITSNLQVLYLAAGEVRFLTRLYCPLEFRA